MIEYIDREKLLKQCENMYCSGCNNYGGVACRACATGGAIDIINDAPAADVAPVVHGKWITTSDVPDTLICSYCGKMFDMWKYEVSEMFYCQHCGAKMDLEG